MGAWGPAIFSDDIACDIRDEYKDLLGDGHTGEAATNILLERWEDEINDPEIGIVFWLALSATQWKVGRLEEWVKTKAIEVIENGSDLQRWRAEGDPKLVKQRETALLKLKEKLNQPQSQPKKIKKAYKSATDLDVGDAISYRLLSGQYVVFRVIGHHEDAGGIDPICEVCDWIGQQIPPKEDLESLPFITGKWGVSQFILGQLSKKEYPNHRTQLVAKGTRPHQQWRNPSVFLWRTLDRQFEEQFDLV
ncbi:MAG: hypothetical protein K0R47_297 [Brevibacillus sp.]|nr:hypothetical protein [Brevibacillus sp.]